MPNRETRMRRPPKQERSRERVDEILAAAKRLIGEKGVDAVKMREIAALSGGPISSVYQYFPNKSAIIETLYGKWSTEMFDLLRAELDRVNSLDELFSAAILVLDAHFERIRCDPAILGVLNAIQADKTLNAIDIAETRLQARAFCEIARPWIAETRFDTFGKTSFLMFQLANSAARLANALEHDEAVAIMDTFKAIIRTQLHEFAKDGTPLAVSSVPG